MTLPGFNADASLSKTNRRYRTASIRAPSVSGSHVAAQVIGWPGPGGPGRCWCSEPDFRRGVLVCLQWVCDGWAE
jgi:hypothetical protein